MSLGGKTIIFQIDTGASINVKPAMYALYVMGKAKTLTMWNINKLTSLGTCRTTLKNPKNNKKYSVKLVVVKVQLMPLLGLSASQQMKLITINEQNLTRVHTIIESSIYEKYVDMFDDKLGKLIGEVHLFTDDNIQPAVMPTRRFPLAIREVAASAFSKEQGQL